MPNCSPERTSTSPPVHFYARRLSASLLHALPLSPPRNLHNRQPTPGGPRLHIVPYFGPIFHGLVKVTNLDFMSTFRMAGLVRLD